MSYFPKHFIIFPSDFRYAEFGPVGNSIIYVDEENNIHYRPSVTEQDELLTTSGKESEIFNGIPDWVFEEEVFEDNKALWWSPDGNKLVWGFFDDTNVDSYLLQSYGSWRGVVKQYPYIEDVPYPKVIIMALEFKPRERHTNLDLPKLIFGFSRLSFETWNFPCKHGRAS